MSVSAAFEVLRKSHPANGKANTGSIDARLAVSINCGRLKFPPSFASGIHALILRRELDVLDLRTGGG